MTFKKKKLERSNDARRLICAELSATSLQSNSAGGSGDVLPLWTLSLSPNPSLPQNQRGGGGGEEGPSHTALAQI